MVRDDCFKSALHALQGVLIVARSMAYDRVDHDDIAAVLDAAEELPRFLPVPDDQTASFRQALVDLAQAFPRLGSALERFDRQPSPATW